jgi:hypothetical protein
MPLSAIKENLKQRGVFVREQRSLRFSIAQTDIKACNAVHRRKANQRGTSTCSTVMRWRAKGNVLIKLKRSRLARLVRSNYLEENTGV